MAVVSKLCDVVDRAECPVPYDHRGGDLQLLQLFEHLLQDNRVIHASRQL